MTELCQTSGSFLHLRFCLIIFKQDCSHHNILTLFDIVANVIG